MIVLYCFVSSYSGSPLFAVIMKLVKLPLERTRKTEWDGGGGGGGERERERERERESCLL